MTPRQRRAARWLEAVGYNGLAGATMGGTDQR